MKKIINISIWTVIIAGILVLVSFIETEYRKTTCKSFEIFIDYQDADPLISVEEITKKVYVTFDTVIGKKLSDINSKNIENLVNKINFIENAEVYTTLTGNMKIRATQRTPIVKIINSANESFYMDKNGILMQASREFTARVLIVNGYISDKYSDTLKIQKINPTSLLDKIYLLASYIYSDNFFKAQIEQIYITKDKEFELVPKVGRQLIIFGDINNMENKFDKLMVFYKQGMNKSGWDKYKKINLKFDNQVVCSKK